LGEAPLGPGPESGIFPLRSAKCPSRRGPSQSATMRRHLLLRARGILLNRSAATSWAKERELLHPLWSFSASGRPRDGAGRFGEGGLYGEGHVDDHRQSDGAEL